MSENLLAALAPTKYCNRCQSDRPLTEFNRNRSRPDGFAHYCRTHQREAERVHVQWVRRSHEAEKSATENGQLKMENARLEDALSTANARAVRILDAYHMSYRHGPDPDPKRCPGCHAAALEDV